MNTGVVVLNGGSSAGKSTIANALQTLLSEPWLTLGVDNLIDALGPAGTESSSLITLSPDGRVSVDERFRQVEGAWFQGLAAIARSGTGVIIDEVFLGGGASQSRLSSALTDCSVLWVGVRCDPDIASLREESRADRVRGMARTQSSIVHEGVSYDIEVDTSVMSGLECARIILQRMDL
ncbi:MAG TPA: AAA family ATPase [Acidimicrobiales bacterium]|nr:AAA family ATPase [Acidimicrobiales bacterium]